MDEGSTEAMENVHLVVEPANDSTPALAPSQGITLQNDVVMDVSSTQIEVCENVTADGDKTMEQDSDTAADKENAEGAERQSRLGGLEPEIEHSSQQIEADNIDIPAESAPDKTAEGDFGVSAGKDAPAKEASEGMDMQKDDLVKAVLEAFEARHLVEKRPTPVLVRGREVDLVQLSINVKACGGYDEVTFWSSISKSLGFGLDCGPLLKLVYAKYLKSLENQRLIANQGVQGLQHVLEENVDNGKAAIRNQSKNRAITPTKKRSSKDGTVIDNPVVDNTVMSSTDGSESLARVLEWMKRLALNPGDPRKGQGARVSRWSEACAGKCETLAARLREVLWKEHEHSVYNFSELQNQDEGLAKKRRGRSRLKGIMKKAHHESAESASY